MEECTTKKNDFIAECARCSFFGRDKSICSSDVVVLVMELPMPEKDLAVEARAFVTKEIGKCSVMVR